MFKWNVLNLYFLINCVMPRIMTKLCINNTFLVNILDKCSRLQPSKHSDYGLLYMITKLPCHWLPMFRNLKIRPDLITTSKKKWPVKVIFGCCLFVYRITLVSNLTLHIFIIHYFYLTWYVGPIHRYRIIIMFYRLQF